MRQIARQLGEHLWLLDTWFLGEPGIIASYLVGGSRGLALVDVGSGVTSEALLEGVRQAGYDPAQITHLILTHIHLDHAGAVGYLARTLPQAKVYVHSAGAPHLLDPAKLVRSATRIYGDRMQEMWGTFEPVAPEKLVVIDDGARLDLGNIMLDALYTPGHAVHHLAYHDAEQRILFPGDVAGVLLEDIPFVRPPTPPPDLDLDLWTASIARIEALKPDTMLLPHFGAVKNAPAHMAEVRARLAEWAAISLKGLREGHRDQAIANELQAASEQQMVSQGIAVNDAVRERLELAANYIMSAQGYIRYFQTLKPELLAAGVSAHGN